MKHYVDRIEAFYDGQSLIEDNRLDRHQLERDITLRYLDRYLPKKGNILEIGAATGNYTSELARRGCSVTAVNISAQLLDLGRSKISRQNLNSYVTFIKADARDLSHIADNEYDAVLLMGPLYHLLELKYRKMVVQQAHSKLKTKGVIFSAFISRLGILGYLMRKTPEWIDDQTQVCSLIESGHDPIEDKYLSGFIGYYARTSEMLSLHENEGFKTITLAGVEPCISADDDSYNNLTGKRRKLWLNLLYEVSKDPSMLESSRHVLYIGQK